MKHLEYMRFQLEQEIYHADKEIKHSQGVLYFLEQFDEEWTEGLTEAFTAINDMQTILKRELEKLLKVTHDSKT